jgi:tetratricopeptide (TPR) repeat protein
MKFFGEARQILEKTLKQFPQSYALWVAMGAFYGDLGDDFKALECFEKAIQYAPENDTTALFNKVQVLAKFGCYQDAVSILKELIQKYPQDPRYFLELGYCNLDMGYPEQALRDYQEALKFWHENPTDYEGGCIYMGIYASYRALGMLKDALAIAQEGSGDSQRKTPDCIRTWQTPTMPGDGDTIPSTS